MRDLKADLELCNKATPGPWYARATDDEVFMNLRYVTTEPASFEHDGCRSFTEGLVQSGDVVALTLLQHPRMADPDKFDENTLFIAQAREGWPHAIERALEAEALARELVATLKKAHEYIGDINSFYGQGLQVHGWHFNGAPEPLDNFIDSNGGCEAEEFVGRVLTKAKEVLGDG